MPADRDRIDDTRMTVVREIRMAVRAKPADPCAARGNAHRGRSGIEPSATPDHQIGSSV
jgi:hypothetical protein